MPAGSQNEALPETQESRNVLVSRAAAGRMFQKFHILCHHQPSRPPPAPPAARSEQRQGMQGMDNAGVD